MNRTALSLLVAAGVALAAAPAFAAVDNSLSPDEAKQLCTKLSGQFQDLKPFKEGLPYWQKAKSEFTSGKQACTGGKPVAGAQSLQAAISDLYVKPDTL